MGARVLVVDNYDSFVYNLVQYLGELGAEPIVHRHDAITVDDAVGIDPDAVLVSPGPGRPEDAGVSNEVIRTFAGPAGRCSASVSGTSASARCTGGRWYGPARSCTARRR